LILEIVRIGFYKQLKKAKALFNCFILPSYFVINSIQHADCAIIKKSVREKIMDYMEILREVSIVAILAYLIGSIPTGYIIVKLFTGQDIRTVGSGSTGATNVKRVMGKKWFFIVMLLDALKGAVPVILATLFASYLTQDIIIPPQIFNTGTLPVVAAICTILGHSKSVYLEFTGGKSVASGVGTLFALNWIVGLSVAVVWSLVTWFSKYVSVGSIVALAIAPIVMWLVKAPVAYIIYTVIAALYVIYLHRENIKRLIAGSENKVR